MKRTIIAVLMLSVALSACGTQPVEEAVIEEEVIEEPEVTFDIVEYKKEALSFSDAIYSTAGILLDIANYEVAVLNTREQWGMSMPLDQDDRLKACEHRKVSFEDLETADSDIKQMYKNFILIENDGSKEATEIENSIREIYSNYCKMYDATLKTGKTINDISNPVSESARNILDLTDLIKLFCEE